MTMDETRTGYDWGQTARLRARRDWLGLSAQEMAEQMSKAAGRPLSRRSYQRMESGENAIHESIWETIEQVEAAMITAVEALLSRVPEGATEHVVHVPDEASGWHRQVIARAAHVDPRIRPKTNDDILAEQEMTG